MTAPAYFVDGTNFPLHHFDAVEVECVRDDGTCAEVIDAADFGHAPAGSRDYWSVYLHFDPTQSHGRGVVCIADLPTRQAAEGLAIGLEIALGSVIGARLVRHYTGGKA